MADERKQEESRLRDNYHKDSLPDNPICDLAELFAQLHRADWQTLCLVRVEIDRLQGMDAG